MEIIFCPKCRAQYSLPPEHMGKQVRCQQCQEIFTASSSRGPSEPPPILPLGSSHRVADEIDYEIFGDDMQYVEVTLDPREAVIAEAGAMMFMTSGIQMETVFGDPSKHVRVFGNKMMSAGKRVFDRRIDVYDGVSATRPRDARPWLSARRILVVSKRCIWTSWVVRSFANAMPFCAEPKASRFPSLSKRRLAWVYWGRRIHNAKAGG